MLRPCFINEAAHQRKASFSIQIVCIFCAKQQCSERRHDRIVHHALQQREPNTSTTPRWIDNHILKVTKGGLVRDYTRKSDLALPPVGAKT